MKAVKPSASVFKTEVATYLKLCEGINTPRALTCWILASSQEWEQLLNLQVFHDDKNVPRSAGDYLVTSIMKKNPRVPLGIDADQVALDKFLECESHVKTVNAKFLKQNEKSLFSDADPAVREVLKSARRIIRKTLGPLTTADLNGVWNHARFGPGSTSEVSGTDVSSSRKYSALSASPRLSFELKKLIPALWWEAAGTLVMPVCWYSKVVTVPKNAKTARPICIEGHLNVWMQLGIGWLLRRKLRFSGLDLDTQADLNRFLASVSQKLGLVTIDLESASDTIASELVRLLLPRRWVHLLEMARTDSTQMPDGTIVGLEKWSSMGNGYTFELESLIFWALAKACNPGTVQVAVFGDDIIVPSKTSEVLLNTLSYCGFRVNWSKTFLGGAFFESCGTDWLSGEDVRPFFFKSEVKTKDDYVDALFKMANQIRQYSQIYARLCSQHGCSRVFLPAWLYVRSQIPARWKNCRVPSGYGDDCGLIGNLDEATPTFNRVFGEFRFKRRRRSSVAAPHCSEAGALLSFLRERSHSPFDHRLAIAKTGSPTFEFYYSKDPVTEVRSKGDRLDIWTAPSGVELRNVKKAAQLATGRCNIWPDLGPWV